MGGGNAQKSATARLRKMQAAQKAPAGSQLKDNAAAQSIVCQICKQTFVCTTHEKNLREHWENRHPKNDFYAAFPHLKPT